MKKAGPLLLFILGILCLLGGVLALFLTNSRSHAAVAIAWGCILLLFAKVGLPENNGLFSRFFKRK